MKVVSRSLCIPSLLVTYMTALGGGWSWWCITFQLVLFVSTDLRTTTTTNTKVVVLLVEAVHGDNAPGIETYNGWIPIEVVTEGDLVAPTSYEIFGSMDGIGAFLWPPRRDDMTTTSSSMEIETETTLRIQVNHELKKTARITELNLNVDLLKRSINESVTMDSQLTTTTSTTGGTTTGSAAVPATSSTTVFPFVESARLAYDTFTYLDDNTDGVSNVATTSLVDPNDDDNTPTVAKFCMFCSSQSYNPNTFGPGRGFVDQLYITGEECSGGRLVVLDSLTRNLYQLSGVTGGGGGGSVDNDTAGDGNLGFGGMPYDSWENAALIDTKETEHIALLLASHGGTETMKLYVGRKGLNVDGTPDPSNSFLARNGLLYGQWYYLGLNHEQFTENNFVVGGSFTNDFDLAWNRPAFEDIDTNPNDPTQVVLAESSSGVYLLDFELTFVADMNDGNDINGPGLDDIGASVSRTSLPSFDPSSSRFTATQLTNFDHEQYRQPDNVDWTANDLVFVNRDSDEGGIWYMRPDGTGKTRIGQTIGDTESTGILDLSPLLGYPPSSVIITTDQLSSGSSMTLLLNPILREFLAAGGGDDSTQDEIVVATPDPVPDIPVPPPRPDDCPLPSSRLDSQVIQAEDASMIVGGSIQTNQLNWCGTGFVEFGEMMSLSTVGIEFTVDIATPGTYRVKIRYANGDRASLFQGGVEGRYGRSGMFFVDSQDRRDDFLFVPTNGWSLWNEESKTATFHISGRHTLEVWWGAGEKRPILDWISLDIIELILDPELYGVSYDE